ncbi:hypothetical protein LUZ60_008006 [Juncus effusus]|nr:hypothetical protein LUZ60_008006 [Juncus effusus]
MEEEARERLKEEATRIICLFPVLPRLVVFDLDYTIWPYDCDMCYKEGMPDPYPHSTAIIHALKEKGVDLAIASRSPTPDIARAFLEKMGVHNSFFISQEIFRSWGPKIEHFKRIQRRTGVPYNSMLFFDDDYRMIQAVSEIGVTCIRVEDGVNLEKLRLGLSTYAHKFA